MTIDTSRTDPDAVRTDYVVVAILLGAIGYNGLLAIINAYAFRVNTGLAIVCEIIILSAAMGWSARKGFSPLLIKIYLFLVPFILLFFYVSILNDQVYPDPLRNILIIISFTALGSCADERSFRTSILIASIVVAAVLVLETTYLEGYVAVFQPERYFSATRGVEAFEFNDTGLFAGALGYSERFSYGIYDGPRTSSIFLEQVSLASFAAVVSVYMLGDWTNMSRVSRTFFCILVVYILVTNNTRASSALVVIFFLGYFIFHRLPPRATLLVGPTVLAMSFLLVGWLRPEGTTSDDLVGRLAITVVNLKKMDAGTLLFGSLSVARRAYDSGYVFAISSSTIFGLMVFWAYVSFVPASRTDAQKRVRWALNIYVWAWMLIGGTAIFTMKTSALLWFVAGHLAARTASLAVTTGRRRTENRVTAIPATAPVPR